MIRRKDRGVGMPKPTRKKLKLSEFLGMNTAVAEENLPFNYSPKTYNFTLEKGVPETGVGVSTAVAKIGETDWEIKKRLLNVVFLKMFYYRTHYQTYTLDRLVAYGEDGHLYETAINVPYTSFTDLGAYGEVLSATVYTYHGDTGLLISTPSGLYFVRIGVVTRLTFAEVCTTMTTHNDRVFAVLKSDEYKLYFSDDFDPDNWNVSLTEGGYISFTEEMGKIVKVLSFGGYVYIFFEHGIRRLSAYNDQTEFAVRTLYLSVGRIVADTIAVCGDRMMFVASDGAYLFDGLSVKKVLTELAGVFAEDQSLSLAAFHDGKYYLACRLDMDSTINGRNSLVIYDIWKGKWEIAHDVALNYMVPLDTENFSGVLTETSYPVSFLGRLDRSGSVNSTATYKVWCSPVTSLGENSGKKLFRELRIRTEGTVTCAVILDGKTYTYTASTGLNVFRVMRPFDRMQIVLSSLSDVVRITKSELTVDFFRE